MPLHLVKLCVGCDGIADLEGWIAAKLKTLPKGAPRAHVHVTRMTPKRVAELLDGGSLYWVIRGEIACRQRLLGIAPFVDRDGARRCALALDPAIVRVAPAPRRAFQGWRYLAATDAPPDRNLAASGADDLPESLCRELRGLGLL